MVKETWEYAVAATVVLSLCFCICGGLVARHFFLVCKGVDVTRAKDIDKEIRIDAHIIRYCTHLSVASFWLLTSFMLALRLFSFARAFDLYPCRSVLRVYTEMFVVGKCAMYAVFAARLRVSFHGSVYKYSAHVIRAMYVVIAIAFVVSSLTVPLAGTGKWKDTNYAADGRHISQKGAKHSMPTCEVRPNRALIASTALFDVGFSVLILVLFTRPLKKLFKNRRDADSTSDTKVGLSLAELSMDAEQAEFELLPLKYTILSGTAIVSTFFSLSVMATTGAGILVPMDNTVNVACLLAMTGPWKGCYWRVCSPLLRCLSQSPWILGRRNKTNVVTLDSFQRSLSLENQSSLSVSGPRSPTTPSI